VPDELATREPGHLLLHLLPGEDHVPGLLEHVDARDHPGDGLHPLVLHQVALPGVEDLLRHQDRGVGARAVHDGVEHPAEAVDLPRRAVRRDAEVGDRLAEHRGVPALVGDLGERVVHVRPGRVVVVEVAQHHLHQQDLEPQPDARDRRHLVPGELDPLLLGQAVHSVVPYSDIRSSCIPHLSAGMGALKSMSTSGS
jgi:hypothetical protein